MLAYFGPIGRFWPAAPLPRVSKRPRRRPRRGRRCSGDGQPARQRCSTGNSPACSCPRTF